MSTTTANAPAAATGPDVTVVVIAFNDADRLPRALASVLDQTLRNLEIVIVDDASTDKTADVAREWAQRDPARIRVVTLPENSGGCSRPRNVGIDAARAPFVMFLDSDDELERHATKNLLLTAEATGADLVSGLCVRVNVTRGNRRTDWYPRLYTDHAVYEGIREAPDLLFDTLCTNKLYRREFLDEHDIRFPEGLHYEDLLFTTEAYCTARRIALIPNEVYRWMVVTDADQVSISNRREDIRNFRDRIEIHRRIDAYLRDQGHSYLRPVKDRKFILQDLRLYLQDLGLRSDGYRSAWLELASAYVRELTPEALDLVGPLPRAAAYLVERGDLPAALNVAELWVRGRLEGGLTVRDGRAYITSDLLDSTEARAALDVTALHLHTAPFSRRNLHARLSAVDSGPSSSLLHGTINDPLGDLADVAELAATLELRSADGLHRIAAGTTVVAREAEGQVTWSARLGARAALPRLPADVAAWELWLVLHRGDSLNASQVTAQRGALKGIDIPWAPSAIGARQRLRLEVADTYVVTGRLEATSAAGSTAARIWSRITRSGVYHDLRRLLTWPTSRTIKGLVYRTLLVHLPLRHGTAVFESQMGRVFADNPKYVYLALRERGDRRRVVWSYLDDPAGFPADAGHVRRDSWRYYYELARAEHWVDNQGFPPQVRPRRKTTYLQTWHGSPYKAMGFDQPRIQFGPPEQRQRFGESVQRWTHFCVQSPFAEETFQSAFHHRAQSLRTGYPRNDRLLVEDPAAAVTDVRRRLDLPDDRRVVLYAPTFRDWRRRRSRAALPLNLARISQEVGDRCFLLVRAHYLESGRVPARYANIARDVSRYPDVMDLLALADGLITDYSSVMFDFALTRRPMLFYAYDLDLYTTARGAYFDLEREAPGPVVRTEDELIAWLADPDAAHEAHAERYRRFLDRFCTYETGKAAPQVVDAAFGPVR